MANEKFYTSDFGFTKAEIEEARKDDTIGNIRRTFGTSNKMSYTENDIYASSDRDSNATYK